MNLPPRWRIGPAIFLAACLASNLIAIPAHADQQPTRRTQAAGEPCPDSEFTCVTVKVPLDHFGPSPYTNEMIGVVFAVHPATGRRKGMFVTAVGGPGASGVHAADSYAEALDESIREHFDLVFFDQRGVGLSGGFQCVDAVAKYFQTDGRAKTPQQEKAMMDAARAFAQACTAKLPSPDRLRFYGTRQAVEDLEAFRKMIGDEKLWLYGESYGTQFAQWYAAAHPDRVAGLILDGAVDLTRSGPQFLRDATQAFNDVLVQTLQACNAVNACKRDTGGDAISAYDRLARRLDRTPMAFNFPRATGRTERRTFNFSDLESAAAGFLYSEGARMLLQRAIASAARNDLAPLARLFYSALGLDPETLQPVPDESYSDAVYYTVTCNDYEYFSGAADERAQKYFRFGDQVDKQTSRLNSVFYGDLPCVYWPDAETPPVYESTPGRNIPTLVLGATADPATPVDQGQELFRRLDNGTLITTRGGAHVIFGRGDACPDEIVTAFLVDGRLPAGREIRCKGVVADDYVPLPPVDARAFKDALEAMQSAENEILYTPEYYYWDQVERQTMGCNRGGVLSFEHTGDEDRFTLKDCAFSKGFVMTGSGSYDSSRDRFTLNVNVSGLKPGTLAYVREVETARITGVYGGKPVNLSR
jgi:pimeloyl-ACP methyl ester carboxylesterase